LTQMIRYFNSKDYLQFLGDIPEITSDGRLVLRLLAMMQAIIS
jgi:hypothetical protein